MLSYTRIFAEAGGWLPWLLALYLAHIQGVNGVNIGNEGAGINIINLDHINSYLDGA